MLNWNVTVAGLPTNPANLLVAALYDPLVPGNYPATPDYYMTVPKPGGGYTGAGIQIIFINVVFKVYDFALFESTDGTPSGTVLIDPFAIQPGLNTAIVRAQIPLIPGTTAGLTDTAYVDATLVGWQYSVQKRAYGPRLIGTEIAIDDAGGFHLLLSGETIDDLYFIDFIPQIIPVNPTTNAITASATITAAITLDSTYKNKYIYIKGAASFIPITLPDINSVSNFDFFLFISAGGVHVSAPITCKSGDQFQYFINQTAFNGNTLSSKITLCQNERLKIYKDQGVWNVEELSASAMITGRIVESDSLFDLNTLLADGTLKNRQTYSRLWDYINNLPNYMRVSEATWAAATIIDGMSFLLNRGFYSVGDGSTTFRMKTLMLYPTRRAVDGSIRLAGSLQTQKVGQFPIVRGDDFLNHPRPGAHVGRGDANPDTGTDILILNADLENRSTNIGVYASICI